MYNETVGVVGGFGAYATLEFYKKFLEAFASDNERNYPHIIFDNDFTMPSRTRAILFDEEYEKVVQMIASSVKKLLDLNCSYIVLVCGTAHIFLDEVYKILPESKGKIIDIINVTKNKLITDGVEKVLVVAAEGALLKKLYEVKLFPIDCINPGKKNYSIIRDFIESVKKNDITSDIIEKWFGFLRGFDCRNVVLGCTEFPVLNNYILNEYSNVPSFYSDYVFFNPIDLTVTELKRIMH